VLAPTHTPHDALFKAVFSSPEHARAVLRAALPPRLARRLDWSSLTLLDGSFVDEALKERHSDLLFRVKLDGKDVFLYLLFEHQSTVDGLMAFRLLRYMVRIWERVLAERPGEPLPLVVPIVLSHAEGGWTAATRFEALFSLPPRASDLLAFVPRFSYVVDDLAATDVRELEARLLTTLAELALRLFRDLRRKPTMEVLDDVKRLFVTLEASETPAHLVSAVLHYVLHNTDEIEQPRVVPWVSDIGPKTRNEAMRSIAQKLIDEGREEGREEGRAEASRVLVLKQLQLKFGAIGPRERAIVDAADLETLERYAERVLTATSLEEVLGS
jgi:predicted transposase/invertase (TIGR01784 family)